jgi:hypothetical protein
MKPRINTSSVTSSRFGESLFRRIFKNSQESESVKGKSSDLPELQEVLGASSFLDQIQDLLNIGSTRSSRYKEYDTMDEDTLPSRSLDVFASLITMGEIDEDDTGSTYKVVTQNEEQSKLFESMEIRTNLRKNLFTKIRTLCKYGLNPQELIFQEYKGIVKLRPIKPDTFRFSDENNPHSGDYPYIQTNASGTPIAKFRPFQIVPLILNSDESRIYGKSLLEPVRKTWKILDVLEMAVVFRELNRAMQKWLWLIDCTGLSKEEARTYAKKIMSTYQKLRYVDSAGKLNLSQNIFKDFGDIALPTFDSKTQVDIKPLPTDPTQNSTGPGSVLSHYLSKFFGGIGIPNYYFSYEGIRQIRSATAMNYADVILAKTIYRIQTSIISDLWDIYRRESEFHGINDFDFKLQLPIVSTVDDLRKFQVMNLKIQIAQTLRINMKFVDDEWVFRFLAFSRKDTERLTEFRARIRSEEQRMLQAAADGVFLQPISTPGGDGPADPYDLQTAARDQRENPPPAPGEEDPFASAMNQLPPEERTLIQEKLTSERTFQALLRDFSIRKSMDDLSELQKMKEEKDKQQQQQP